MELLNFGITQCFLLIKIYCILVFILLKYLIHLITMQYFFESQYLLPQKLYTLLASLKNISWNIYFKISLEVLCILQPKVNRLCCSFQSVILNFICPMYFVRSYVCLYRWDQNNGSSIFRLITFINWNSHYNKVLHNGRTF